MFKPISDSFLDFYPSFSTNAMPFFSRQVNFENIGDFGGFVFLFFWEVQSNNAIVQDSREAKHPTCLPKQKHISSMTMERNPV